MTEIQKIAEAETENLIENTKKAIEQAKLENGVNDANTAVLVTGSVVTAGEARAIIRRLKERSL